MTLPAIDTAGCEVWTLTASEAGAALHTAGIWQSKGRDVDTWDVPDTQLERRRVAAALAQAAVTKALGGYTPPHIRVMASEEGSAVEVVVQDRDPDDGAVMRVVVRIADPIQDSTYTMLGWAFGRERALGRIRREWGPPFAYSLPNPPPHDFPELRNRVRRGEFRGGRQPAG